jgi:hypothetical protein
MSRVRDLASILTASSVLGTDVEVATAVSNHSAASNPHTEYVQKTLTTTTGDIIYASSANTPARLGIGSTDQVLKVSGGVPSWSTPAVATPTFVGCSLYNTTSHTIANNTETIITYDSEYIDTHGFHESVTNPSRITIPAGYAGKYLISATNRYEQSATGARNMNLYVNNSNVLDMMNLPGNSATVTYLFRSVIYTLAVGDFVQIRANHTSGGGLTMYNRTYELPFSVQWLGA